MRAGKPALVSDFRQGDKLSATIITSMPPQVMTEKEVQATLARRAAPAASTSAGAGAAAAPVAKPAAAPVAKPAAQSAPAGQGASATSGRTLPKTASPLPLVGLAGLGSLVAAIVARRRRLSR